MNMNVKKNDTFEIGVKVSLSKCLFRDLDNKCFVRYLSDKDIKFVVFTDDCVFELLIEKPDDIKLPIYDSNGRDAKYCLDNEMEIFRYLGSLNKETKIIDMYTTLCNEYLGDINKYPLFSLNISRLDSASDMLVLKKGLFEQAVITTDDGHVVYVDKEDNWRVKISACANNPVSFTLQSSNKGISCNFSCSNSMMIRDYINKPIGVDISIATSEVRSVKRKIKSIIKNSENDSK